MKIKKYDKLEGENIQHIEITDCDGNPNPVYLRKYDTLTVTVCGTAKTPCPKRVTYSNTNGVLKFESYTNHP